MAATTRTTSAASYLTEQFEKGVNEALVAVGEKFGLYSELASIGRSTTEQLAERSGIDAGQIRRWLCEQAEAGYVDYDQSTDRFALWCDLGRN